MAAAKAASMPPDLELSGNYTVRVTALAASDGSVLTSVKVSALAMLIANIGGAPIGDFAYGPFMFTPGPAA